MRREKANCQLPAELQNSDIHHHTKAKGLHYDIKADNILLASISLQPSSDLPDVAYQIATDFGNGTTTKILGTYEWLSVKSLCTTPLLLMAFHQYPVRV